MAVEEMTIDELARRVGMTVRNVRAHQSRGILPPPELRGRTGYYGEEHVARLELVKDLQAEGFNLEAIRRILDRTAGDTVEEVLGLTRAVVEPWGDEEPEFLDAGAFRERWGAQLTPEVVEKSFKLGFVRQVADDRFEVPSPRLHQVAEQLSALGVPLVAQLDVLEEIERASEKVARAYVKLFIRHLWRPFADQGEPADWQQIRAAVDQLRPMAGEALLRIFGIVMTRTAEEALERELSRFAERKPRR